LTRFIERRDDQRRQTEGERLEDDLWMETVKAYDELERRQRRAEWRDYHESQAERHRRTLAALIAHHEGEAQKLCESTVAEGG
jgi:hypothetical protein